MFHTHRPVRLRRRAELTVSIATTVAALVLTAVASPEVAGAASNSGLTFYGGYTYGTTAHVGSFVSSGRSAVTSLCTSHSGVTRTNHTAAVAVPNVGTIGAVSTTMSTRKVAGRPVSIARTQTAGINLLGVIHASAITTTARVERTASGIVRTGSTNIVGLSIAGTSSPPAEPSVNQTITIPGIATIELNKQIRTQAMGDYRMKVIALTVTIPAGNALHVPAGQIVIGRGAAALHRQTAANAQGYAYGTSVNVAKLAGSGRTSAVYLPCGGTDGQVVRNHLAKANIPSVLGTGVVTSSGSSHETRTATSARTANSIAHATLLGGVLKLGAVKVSAQVVRDRSGAVHRTTTASILDLRINGQHQSGAAPANTKMSVPGLGTLWLHRVIRTPNGVTVRALDLILGKKMSGLNTGTEIIVGAAHAAVSKS